MISDQEFIKLFNAIAKVAKTPSNPPAPAESLDDNYPDLNIDSLDGLIMGMYLCDAFGIPEEIGKTMQVKTVSDTMQFCLNNATVDSVDVDSVIAGLK